MNATTPIVRDYRPADAAGWVRCRTLAFLHTQYYDDVQPVRAPLAEDSLALVASDGEQVVGLLDIEIERTEATIDSIATHPDHQGGGIGTRLLEWAVPLLTARGVRSLDAWTREDVAANNWYRRNGFTERHRYLHVYLGHQDDASGFSTPEGLSAPVSTFTHASIEDEATMRERYRRVYICRQYLRELDPAGLRPKDR